MVGWPSIFAMIYMETELFQVQVVDKDIDEADFIIRINRIIQGNREKVGLCSVLPFDVLHSRSCKLSAPYAIFEERGYKQKVKVFRQSDGGAEPPRSGGL